MSGYTKIKLDTIPPQGAYIELNGGKKYTEKREVILQVKTSDINTSGYSMKLWGEDIGISSEYCGKWESFQSKKELFLIGNDGEKYVYAYVMDDLGNETVKLTARIRLNTSGKTIIEPNDYYNTNGLFSRKTFLIDQETINAVAGNLSELLGKIFAITDNEIAGYGKPGDLPVGYVEHIGYENDWSENVVATIRFNTVVEQKVSGDVSAGDFLCSDGDGSLKKSETYTNAKAYYVSKDGYCNAYIHG